MNIKDIPRKLKNDIPALYLSLRDNRTPFTAKAFAFITVGYALSPIDLIPDFIPLLGYLDDIIILPFLVYLTLKFIPDEVINEYRIKSEGMWKDGKPKRWYYALLIVFVWLLVVVVIVKTFYR